MKKDVVCFSSENYIRRTSRDVNHFSVENPAIYRSSRDVNHFSVENPAILRSSRDVNHFSVENPAIQFSILENITFNGDAQSFNSRNNQHEPIYSIRQLYKNFVFGKNWRNFRRFSPLIFCVITSLLKIFGFGGVRILNYRVIDTPRRVLIKKSEFDRAILYRENHSLQSYCRL